MADREGPGRHDDEPDGLFSQLWRSVFGPPEEAERPSGRPSSPPSSADAPAGGRALGEARPLDVGPVEGLGEAQPSSVVALDGGEEPAIRIDITRIDDEAGESDAAVELLEYFPEREATETAESVETPESAGEPGTRVPPRKEPEEADAAARLAHPDTHERREALRTLVRRPGTAPVVAVAARLRDPDPEVRSLAVAVLEAQDDDGVLLLLLDAMRDPSEGVRRAVRRAFVERRTPSLGQLLRRELDVPRRCEAAAELLAEMDELDTLLEAMHDADRDTRLRIRRAIEARGVPARLVEELRDPSPDRRRLAAERLGLIGHPDAVDELILRLEDPDRGVRIKAAEALGAIGDPAAIHPLKRAFIWDPEMTVVVAVGRALRAIPGAAAPVGG